MLFFFTASTFKPWHILADEKYYLDAVVWALSDNGGRLWNETKNDVYIVDPHGKITFDSLKAKLLQDDWAKENIPDTQIHKRPCLVTGLRVGRQRAGQVLERVSQCLLLIPPK